MTSSLIDSIFGKSIHSLTKDDISTFFKTEKRETDVIEFKSYVDEEKPGTNKRDRDKEKLKDIIRTVCGFLNSDGGILIWGAPKGQKKSGSELIYKGELTHVKFKLEPDQFINIISSEISPTPLRILFQPIALGIDTFCYVFQVSKSEFAPHQYKGTYFMRMDGSTRPAPHHYIEALIKKISFPKIEGTISFGQMQTYNETAGVPMVVTIHNMSKYQHEKNIQFMLVSVGGDVFEANYNNFPKLVSQTQINKKAKDMLLFNMPYTENFLLVTNRLIYKQSAFKVLILLTTWGELSPAITSTYELNVFHEPSSRKTNYQFTVKNENVYLMDAQVQHLKSDKERIDDINKSVLQYFEAKTHELPLVKILNSLL
jgi:hypothetical protein